MLADRQPMRCSAKMDTPSGYTSQNDSESIEANISVSDREDGTLGAKRGRVRMDRIGLTVSVPTIRSLRPALGLLNLCPRGAQDFGY
jgi:hypothetical protein